MPPVKTIKSAPSRAEIIAATCLRTKNAFRTRTVREKAYHVGLPSMRRSPYPVALRGTLAPSPVARLLGNATFFRFRSASIYRFARLTSSAMQPELLTPIGHVPRSVSSAKLFRALVRRGTYGPSPEFELHTLRAYME